MAWVLGVVILAFSGFMLRRLLYSGGESSPVLSPMDPLGPCRETFYRSVAQEVETRIGILAVSLNEVLEQDDRGRADLASRLLSLVGSEWRHLDELVLSLQDLMLKYSPLLTYAVPVRSASPRHFRSSVLQSHIGTLDELSQFVFRPRLRFHIHVGVLRSAGRTLTEEFSDSVARAQTAPSVIRRSRSLLDLSFHDYDLIAKDSLLALRMALAALPDELLSDFGAELKTAARREARAPALISRA